MDTPRLAHVLRALLRSCLARPGALPVRTPLLALLWWTPGSARRPVKYQRRIPGLFAGYEEEEFPDRTWRVRVGLGRTDDRPNLAPFAFYRSAELALEHACPHFVVLSALEHRSVVLSDLVVSVVEVDIRLLADGASRDSGHACDAAAVVRQLNGFIAGRRPGGAVRRLSSIFQLLRWVQAPPLCLAAWGERRSPPAPRGACQTLEVL